jgi:arylsulfatase A-like enzyme
MTESRPNIVLIMTDQQRGDCLGIEGHPVLQTPYLDALGAEGVRFARAYSACPVCVPARRTLMSGQRPRTHGVVMNYDTLLKGPTLPGELARAGYQTHLVGKLHLWPHRKLYGFTSADWADGPTAGVENDYQRFLRLQGVHFPNASDAHGMNGDGWAVRPWHLDERLHFTNWCVDRAIEFLERRDPTLPFFLKLSFLHPHQPLTPPACYYDRYLGMDLPEPCVGDWARVFEGPVRGLSVESWRTSLDPVVMKQFRAAYYASINHIDNQVGRILKLLPRNTALVFTADHGEMLGDHQWIRKRNPYEPSARIPLLMRFPETLGLPQRKVLNHPVELMDVMPTLLEAAGAPIPESVEGRSVLPLLRGETKWRDYLHGECSEVPSTQSGMQYLTDGKKKYIWLPGPGVERFFDLEKDPCEMQDLSGRGEHSGEVRRFREILMRELAGRPEGFTDGKELKRLGKPTPNFLPGFEREG